jgi:hypothetical protein
MYAKRLAGIAVRLLQSPAAMTNMPSAFEAVSPDRLNDVTGGGIGSTIGGLFGAKGAQWGGIADAILGMVKGGGGSGGSSGGGSSGGGGGGGGGGGFAGILGKVFSGGGGSFGGGGSSGSSGGDSGGGGDGG